jgi:amino acid adenylation domain-containing protein/non-ribosomal peptide synthase protein (TIGR01720 family)
MAIVDKQIQASTILKDNNFFSEKIYWLNQLSGDLPETRFINDYVRSSSNLVKKQSLTFELSDKLSSKILSLSQKSYLSIYLILLSVFNIYLYKYTGNNDIIIGSPIYKWKGQEKLVNRIIPLRCNIENTLTFKEFLLKVKRVTVEAYCHQSYPIEELITTLNKSSVPVVLLENIHKLNYLEESDRDLIISFAIKENSITGKIDYNQLVFKYKTIDLIYKQYVSLIEILLKNIHVKISEISWIAKQEQQILLQDFNHNTKHYPVTFTLQQLFEKQVEKTPKNIAVVNRTQNLTYQQLNQKANQLARYLQNLGIEKGEFVAILKQRDADFLIAIVAILKAGGVYVPIDSTYPRERIKYMLADSEVKVVLTDSSSSDNLTDLATDCPHLKHLISLDGKLDLEDLERENLEASNRGIDPAYTIYTSGSTGLPKGAIIRHGGAINHIYAQFDALELTEDFVFLQSAPASSDISVWQFLAPILIGGRTVIVDSETICQPEKLFETIEREKITLIELVPLVLRSLLDYVSHLPSQTRCLPHLKWMMVTGESVSVDLVNEWLNYYPSIKVVNAYGPTEAADDITQAIADKPLPKNLRSVSIGKPLANLNIYILDRSLQLVPIGFPGEICVSGYGVGLGYWKNEASTNLNFIPNPFSENAKPLPGIDTDLIYRTGDLGRWLPDGNLEFLGRIDHQVKIRGFRIELGEIETVLKRHPAVREVVVVARDDLSQHKRLVAYLVPKHEDSELIPELRNLLKKSLPEQMMPSAFVLLESLPQTPSGKVDRKALPTPELETSQSNKTFVAPQTAIEKTLVKIWEPVLGVDRVGIHDNFFELGGDSILCIQVIAKAHQEGLNITPKQVFQQQTIAELAPVVSTTENISAEQGLVTGEVVLTPLQQEFLAQNLEQPHHWNEAVLLEIAEKLDPQLLERVLQELLLHHDALRLRFEKTKSGWKQIHTEPVEKISFSYLDLSTSPAEERRSIIEATADGLQTNFDLAQPPLLRIALFDIGTESRLLIVIHHLIVDSLSWRILIEDLQTAYGQLSKDKAIALSLKTTSFKQWLVQLQEYANSPSLQQELDYWLNESRQNISPIPVDDRGGANIEASVRTVSVKLDRTETQSLLKEIPAVYRTQIEDILLTALVKTFVLWTGKRSLLVNLESYGREEIFDNINLSRTVGLFSSIFPVHLELEENLQLGEALKAIKEQLRAIPNKGIGYGLLRYLHKDDRVTKSLSLLPAAEIVFNYLGQFDRTLSESDRWKLTTESTGKQSSPKNRRTHLLSFNSFVINGQLQLNCTYSDQIYHRTTIESLTQKFLEVLRSLISHCQSEDAGGVTPSDFNSIELSQDELDAALEMVEF